MGFLIRATEYNSQEKTERDLDISNVTIPDLGSLSIWIDIDSNNQKKTKEYLESLGIDQELIDELFSRNPVELSTRSKTINFIIVNCYLEDGKFGTETVKCILGYRSLITIHDGEISFIDEVRKGYITDFHGAAKGPIFLVYEMWQHIIEDYFSVHISLQRRMKNVDDQLSEGTTDDIVKDAQKLHTDYLAFREIILPSRVVLNYLGHKGNLFISDNTKPFLFNMIEAFERLVQDITTERQILSDSVNFHVSLVSYKMDVHIKRLTAISLIFMPLTYIASIYGMNFEYMPEFAWRFGYHFFWAISAVVLIVSLFFVRRAKLL